nr:pirin-like C-terminal cupin domain-containing protein [Sulfolobus acidocaldarius]
MDGEVKIPVKNGYTVLVYVVDGKIKTVNTPYIDSGNLIIFDREGDEVDLSGNGRFILISGRPLNEPVYWYGPIVMNSEEQILEALNDLRNGTFVRKKEPLHEDF